MSWVAVGVAIGAGGLLLSGKAGREAKKNANREQELSEQAGQARNEAAQLEADVLDRQAIQTRAAAQRDMFDVQRAARLAESRAVALAAASGGGASAPTVLNIVGNIAKEGAYNAARAMYAGEEQARLMQIQAIEKRKLGQFDMTAGNLAGLAAEGRGKAAQLQSQATILANTSTLATKYGQLFSGGNPSGGGARGTDFTSSAGAGDIPSTGNIG